MLTAIIEDLTAKAIAEIKPLLPSHYDELSEHKLAGIPLEPQYDLYLARAAAGQVLYVTLREQGQLIGYLVSFVAPGMHYKSCLTATGDIFFVYPTRRGLEGGKTLFTAWLKECRRRGIQLAQIGMKSRHAKYVRPILEELGFIETEITFWQFLGDES
jgi:GNAT superfamily N-acetyltransferase